MRPRACVQASASRAASGRAFSDLAEASDLSDCRLRHYASCAAMSRTAFGFAGGGAAPTISYLTLPAGGWSE